MSGKILYFKYVAHDRVHDWLAAGWKEHDSLKGTHHGEHAALMEWTGTGEPQFPEPCQPGE